MSRYVWTGLHDQNLTYLPRDAIGAQEQWDQEICSVTFNEYLFASGWGRYRGAPPGIDEWFIHPLYSEGIQRYIFQFKLEFWYDDMTQEEIITRILEFQKRFEA